ncbi:hypothetical protein B0174_11870 [Arcobacter caeni]|uniref:Uncharacterized protein n=1 Tax=Arcobacter caeni TaxID=1912877 RepID=A0A363CX29_9BACT|nr:hypothetical protein B0174_11870 [Arcobacter caeni]
MIPFNKSPYKGNSEKYIYFILFSLLSIYLFITHQVRMTLNDDSALYMFLTEGERGTLIMSYPLSSLMSKLYEIFPSIQWQSGLYTFCIFIFIFTGSYYIKSVNSVVFIILCQPR